MLKLNRKVGIVTLVLISVVSLLGTSCSKVVPFFTDTLPSFMEDVVDDITSDEPEHTIELGGEVDLGGQTVKASGGTVSIEEPDGPLDGFEIEVPPDAYGASKQFKVSYAPITGHDFDENFDPITPLITVENGGEYADDLMYVTIPADIPEGKFAMAFYFDAATGKLEGIPPVSETPDAITVTTRHFSDFLVSIVDEQVLTQDIDSGFRPGVDDWQFGNYGSYISPGGHCWGQSLTAMWYYCEQYKKGAPHLYGLYDNNGGVATPDLWQDDSWGYRLASTVQEDSHKNELLFRTGLYISESNQLTYRAFAYSILLTGEPQYVRIHQSAGNSIHAMVVYRVAGNTLYIADPNYHGDLNRKIELVNGKFVPYNSGANAEEIAAGRGKVYDKIDYLAKTTFIDWDEIGRRWDEFEAGTIGSDRFPAYDIKVGQSVIDNVPYTEGFKTNEETIRFYASPQNTSFIMGCSVWKNGVNLTPGDYGYDLSPGRNQFGLEVVCMDDGWEYVDFVYVDIYTTDLYIDPAAASVEPGDTVTFTAHTDNLPASPSYQWDFGDGASGDSAGQVSHQYNEAGHYTVNLTLYDDDSGEIVDLATAEVNVLTESTDLVSLLHDFTTFELSLDSTAVYQDWLDSYGESTNTDPYGMHIPWAWRSSGIDITWDGTTFSGTLLHGDPDYMGRIDEIQGTVSADGTVIESIVHSYRYRDEGTDWVTRQEVNLEFRNIPLAWDTGYEAEQSEIWCEMHGGSEVQSRVARVEVHYETDRYGSPESSHDYVSNDWSPDDRLFVILGK